MNWSTVASLSGPYYQVATKKDLLIYNDVSSTSVMAIRRRNADGIYVPVGNFTEVTSPFASTNGKWVSLYGEGMALFSIDNNNHISNVSFVTANGGFLLSDDTFVGYDPVSPLNDGNFTIRTFEYNASNNTWLNIPGTEVVVTTPVNYMGELSTYRATDTHLVFADFTNGSDISVKFFERQADKSWKFIESLPVNSTFGPVSVNYNGIDTLVCSTPSPQFGTESGIVFVYTKSNGMWNEQTFTTTSVGFKPQGYLGYATVFLDANNLMVTASLEGYPGNNMPNGVGKVLMMTRNANGAWEPSVDLPSPTEGSGIWGLGVGVNDFDIIVPNIVLPNGPSTTSLTFYTIPRCFAQPINVTCNDEQVSDCSQVDISALYTINNPQCGAVHTTLTSVGLEASKAIQAHFSFTKFFGAPASCNATVTCPAPPVVVTQTPSKVSSAGALEFAITSLIVSVVVTCL